MKKPGLLLSLVPVIVLIFVLTVGVRIFGEDVTSGPSQIALILAAITTCIIGVYKLKIPWEVFEESIGENMKKTSSAIYILLMIGALTSTWMLSGVVPTMIYYGLKLINPSVFVVVSFLLCAIVSVLAGSSWTTVGTIGVAMLSAGQIIGIPVGWLAGSIISGAYLGDKISPLSDTTNLSASIAGVDLYKHVKYMMITTIPALVICLIVYTIVGFVIPVSSTFEIGAQMEALKGSFNISLWLMLIPCATIFMIIKKIPPFLTLFISAFLGAVVAFWAQPHIIEQITDTSSEFTAFCITILKMMSSEIDIETGNTLINTLTSTKGMFGMVNTVWIIICVISLGGSLSACGMIQTITEKMLRFMKNTASIVASTVFTCIFCNIILADQYMAILLPGKMFSEAYRKKGYAPELLSRTLEDSATVSSVLIPWNTCAVAQAGVLGVATMTYFPFAIFCFVTPIIAIIIAAVGYKIHRIPIEQPESPVPETIIY
ncbi:MAG: Na+/H+ antiporter NhaC family protein [Bacteroidales bacterium]|nr:Na+/H+ antiporter NhaC family protein [Bacteroidales bacterium]MDD4670138.1 Na+/H+ antiporter NhaC family protein [Bacteroidales bacterium]